MDYYYLVHYTNNQTSLQTILEEVYEGITPQNYIQETRTVRFNSERINYLTYEQKRAAQLLSGAIQRWFDACGTDMSAHYQTFFIPKRSGGMREINAPSQALQDIMKKARDFIEYRMQAKVHNAAFAYVKGRSTKHALQKHQANGSKFFLKIDLKDFFPSCTPEFVLEQLRKLHWVHQLEREGFSALIESIVKLATLNGHLPQGSPLSPMLTNLIMIPIDQQIERAVYRRRGRHIVYTRYADDMLFSCTEIFSWQLLQNELDAMLEGTPLKVNREKTRFGTAAGRNWNLGLMLNKDNNITIGHKQKKHLKAGVNNFLRDWTNNQPWDIIDVERLVGNISYFYAIEPEYCDYVISQYEAKYNLNWKQTVKAALN